MEDSGGQPRLMRSPVSNPPASNVMSPSIPRSFALGVFFIATVIATGCGTQDLRPNILLIVWDTVRADRLGIYGNPRQTTPMLDEWAQRARVFDCTSASNWTAPSHASMFTGLYPSEHGVTNQRATLSPRESTLAELLSGSGYETYLFSANPIVSSGTGLARGFMHEAQPPAP